MNYSSDGLMLNLYDVMLELSRKIYNDQNMLKKVNPSFYIQKRLGDLQYQPLV